MSEMRLFLGIALWALGLIGAVVLEARPLAVVLALAAPITAGAIIFGTRRDGRTLSQTQMRLGVAVAVLAGVIGAAAWLFATRP